MALRQDSRGGGMDPIWKAMSKLRRGKLDECIEICNESLSRHPNDQVFNSYISYYNYFNSIFLNRFANHKS